MKRVTRVLLRQFARAARPYLEAQGLMRTTKVFSTSALIWEPGAERLLVLAPHMDDETIGCGGTLARHMQAGAKARVVFLTDGRAGGSGIARLDAAARRSAEAELVRTRKEEARRALAILGIESVSFLDAEDGKLAQDRTVAARLREILAAERPELIYVPHFVEQHPDHTAASAVLFEALRELALSAQVVAYEVWTPLFPNCVVKIDDVLEIKRRALAEYRSQLAEFDYLHTSVALNAYRSAAFSGQHGLYAEAFCSLGMLEYQRMYTAYRSTP
jgi:LmbE family N-acetylglucosaminyl deacetylase